MFPNGGLPVRLQLVSNRSQEVFALLDVGSGLHFFRRGAVYDAEDPATLLGLGDDHLPVLPTV